MAARDPEIPTPLVERVVTAHPTAGLTSETPKFA